MIHWLGTDSCHEHRAVGGKAASLSRWASHYTVPPGFAIEALPCAIAELPHTLAGAIGDAYHALARRLNSDAVPVAVRSSALDEDGAAASFAGQHDTYLNVRGADAVVDAVHRCVRSAASPEAVAYRSQRGLPFDDVRIAVLVQELVPADVSAVAFSMNPLSGSPDEIMINANWGLGESIVGGTATPDTFVVAKDASAIVWRDIAPKERMTVLSEAGTRDVDVPRERRDAPSIADEHVLEIARLVGSLESAAGHPVDIECAFAAGRLYLLQCRPITTR